MAPHLGTPLRSLASTPEPSTRPRQPTCFEARLRELELAEKRLEEERARQRAPRALLRRAVATTVASVRACSRRLSFRLRNRVPYPRNPRAPPALPASRPPTPLSALPAERLRDALAKLGAEEASLLEQLRELWALVAIGEHMQPALCDPHRLTHVKGLIRAGRVADADADFDNDDVLHAAILELHSERLEAALDAVQAQIHAVCGERRRRRAQQERQERGHPPGAAAAAAMVAMPPARTPESGAGSGALGPALSLEPSWRSFEPLVPPPISSSAASSSTSCASPSPTRDDTLRRRRGASVAPVPAPPASPVIAANPIAAACQMVPSGAAAVAAADLGREGASGTALATRPHAAGQTRAFGPAHSLERGLWSSGRTRAEAEVGVKGLCGGASGGDGRHGGASGAVLACAELAAAGGRGGGGAAAAVTSVSDHAYCLVQVEMRGSLSTAA